MTLIFDKIIKAIKKDPKGEITKNLNKFNKNIGLG